MGFGEALRRARKDLGWTQPDLADAIRRSSDERFRPTPSELSRYERGRVKNPRLDFISACAAATGRSVKFFTDDAGREQQESEDDEEADQVLLSALRREIRRIVREEAA